MDKVAGTCYQVTTAFACGGVIVSEVTGKVTQTAPIFKWMLGKAWVEVQKWNRIQRVVKV